MVKKGLKTLIFMLILILPLASAFQANYSLEKSYFSGENLKGIINISFDGENADSLIRAEDFSGSIKLKDFLDLNDVKYNCSPLDCKDSHEASNVDTEKSFSLNYDEEEIVGLKLAGMVDNVNGLSFNVSCENAASCSVPLKIDVLSDGIKKWEPDKVTEEYECGIDNGLGCFENVDTEEKLIGNNKYCEKITLPKAKKFKLGAWVKGNESTEWNENLLTMQIYELDGNLASGDSSCSIEEPSLEGSEIGCVVNFENSKNKEYYVCLEVSSNTKYRVKREDEEPCGFYGNPADFSEYNFDYYIFARGSKFDNIGSFQFNQEEYEEESENSLVLDIKNYLSDRYGTVNGKYDCESDCVVPIKFEAFTNLNMELSNLNLQYTEQGHPATGETTNSFYDLNTEPASIYSNFVELDLSKANITVPSSYGNYSLRLKLDEEEILDEEVSVEKVPMIRGVFPTHVSSAVSSTYVVNVELPSNRSIVSYVWNFSGEVKTTETNKVEYVFQETGNYQLNIEIEDEDGYKASKEFTITVDSPEKFVNSTIKDYEDRIDNITSQMQEMPEFKKKVIKEKIDISSLEQEIKMWKRKYESATTDEEFNSIMNNLSEIKIPKYLETSNFGSIPFYTDWNQIKPELFYKLNAGIYNEEREESYKKAIAAWCQENLDMTLETDYMLAYYDEKLKNLASFFTLNIKPKQEKDEEIYLIIGHKDILFDKTYNTKDFDEAVAVRFQKIENKKIMFAVLKDLSVEEIVVYASPVFEELTVSEEPGPCNFNSICEKEKGENWKNCRSDCKPWGWAFLWILLLILAAFFAYLGLEYWYKRYYEKKLFKNRNNLFNLINFIENAKKQGLSRGEIKKKLKENGWSGEKINYAFKKLKGEGIMPVDLEAFLKRFKIGFSNKKQGSSNTVKDRRKFINSQSFKE